MSDDGPEYGVDFREHPEEYEIGCGEEGVFKVQPHKDELLREDEAYEEAKEAHREG